MPETVLAQPDERQDGGDDDDRADDVDDAVHGIPLRAQARDQIACSDQRDSLRIRIRRYAAPPRETRCANALCGTGLSCARRRDAPRRSERWRARPRQARQYPLPSSRQPLRESVGVHPTGDAPPPYPGEIHDHEDRQDGLLAGRDPGDGAVLDQRRARAGGDRVLAIHVRAARHRRSTRSSSSSKPPTPASRSSTRTSRTTTSASRSPRPFPPGKGPTWCSSSTAGCRTI